ncbi:MAG TPA: glycosyltransferase [Deltaproteobacteria bacterium]|mgnify:CR=1 FL=1|nr:glycosyltransferase [Deltaproteobacteria bacterium]
MEAKTYNIVVLLLTDNNAQTIDRSIQSILDQSIYSERIKVIAVDNHSTDGTYKKLLGYVKSNDISVYRLDKRYLKTRQMNHANNLMRHTMHAYMTILEPSDVLYPDYLERCTNLLDDPIKTDCRIIFSEVDLIDDEGKSFKQTPMFDEDRVLRRKKSFVEVFNKGLGHKVQCFYRAGVIPKSLFELPHFVDFTDCFRKAFFLQSHPGIYMRTSQACICKTKYPDKIVDLVSRFYLITRLKVFRDTLNDESVAFLKGLDSEDIYRNLSGLALEYASESLADGETGTARRILLFAEMVFKDIVHSDFYSELKAITVHKT